MYNLLRSIRKERFIRYGKGTALYKEALSLQRLPNPPKTQAQTLRSLKHNIIFPGVCTHAYTGNFYFIFSFATDSISLIRLSWLTSLAPGS